MTVRSEFAVVLRLAIPVIIAELGWMLMGVADTMMVGRLGPAAIGAVSIGNILFDALAFFGIGLLLGMDTMVSQAFGGGRRDECNRWLWQGVYLATIAAPVLAIPALASVPLVRSWGVAPVVRDMAVPYLVTMLWSLWPLLLYAAFRRYLQGMSLVKPVTVALLSANLVNILANWILIYGRLGAPALGVTGAGWATFWARVWMAGTLGAYIGWREFRSSTGLFHAFVRPNVIQIVVLLRLGVPAAGQILIEVAVFGAATALIGLLDTASLAAHHIALTMAGLTFMVPLGVSSAGAVSVGQAVGRGDPGGARRSGWIALTLGAGFMTFSAVVFTILPEEIIRIFTDDAAVVSQGTVLLMLAAVFQLFDGVQVVATGVLRGIGDTSTPMVANLIGHWALGLPFGYYLCFVTGWRAPGLWAGLSLGLIVVGFLLLAVWMRRSGRLAAPDVN